MMNPSSRHTRTRHGFTLIELLGVIAVMIIMSTIVIGGYYSMMSGYAIRTAMNHFRGALELAKQRASMQGTRVYVWVTAEPGKDLYHYTVVQQAGVVSDASNVRKNPVGSPIIIDEYGDLSQFAPWRVDPEVYESGRDYTKSVIYNLGSHTRTPPYYRFRIVEDKAKNQELKPNFLAAGDGVGWQIPLRRLSADGTATSVLQNNDWNNGDRYGWEVTPPFSLPIGFKFDDGDESMANKPGAGFDYVYFNPDGSSGSKAGGDATFIVVEERSGEKCYVKVSVPRGDIQASLDPL